MDVPPVHPLCSAPARTVDSRALTRRSAKNDANDAPANRPRAVEATLQMNDRLLPRAGGPRRTALAALALVGALLATDAHAYKTIVPGYCQGGEAMRWRGGPSSWYLNREGSRTLEFDQVKAILLESFASWSEPCCSGFRTRYEGITSSRSYDPSQQNVVFFETDPAKWPDEAGRAAIGITLFRGDPTCAFTSSITVFNEIDWTFFDFDEGLVPGQANLHWIATHEFGHWLGLDHSEEAEAIMRPNYTSGASYEGLSEDDIAGVCALYPGSCESCERNADCPSGSACRDGACVASECRTTIDCAMGTICEDELCVPGCRTHRECPGDRACLAGACVDRGASCARHVDCDEGESCVAGFCRLQPEGCDICARCSVDTDCDLYETCVITNHPDLPAFCSNVCETDRDCVGSSVCRQVTGAPSKFCMDPVGRSANDFCAASYSCTLDEPGPTLGCALLGSECTEGSLGCGGRADTCIDTADGVLCSCTCHSDSDCGAEGRCLVDPTNELPSCYPLAALIPCADSFCLEGLQCVDGSCVEDPCAGVSCSPDASCVDGECVTPKPPPAKNKSKNTSSCAMAGGAGGGGLLGLLIALGSLRRRTRP